jgi:hypothetical protein
LKDTQNEVGLWYHLGESPNKGGFKLVVRKHKINLWHDLWKDFLKILSCSSMHKIKNKFDHIKLVFCFKGWSPLKTNIRLVAEQYFYTILKYMLQMEGGWWCMNSIYNGWKFDYIFHWWLLTMINKMIIIMYPNTIVSC